ncbi:MAG: DUF2169 domain-containing protein [Planctomycetota bacterium]
MGHPTVHNRTPFEFDALHAADEDGRPVIAPIVRGTFVLDPSGRVTLAEEQDPVRLAGLAYGTPGETSYRLEPETAFVKPGTDVVLVGHAHAAHAGCTQMEVSFELGPVRRRLRVTGDRHWDRTLLGAKATKPAPFERVPLVWERAFGGWDRHEEAEEKHRYEGRNPLGVGYRRKSTPFLPGRPLPSIEDPRDPQTGYAARCKPAGTGFTGHHWEPRRKLAGTYDKKWEATRKPLLPTDFDRRFFHSAPAEQVVPDGLRGDERGRVEGATPEGVQDFALPGIAPPRISLALARGETADLETRLDTVVVDTDARCLFLTWRAHHALREGPHDVAAITIEADGVPEERAALPDPVPFDLPLQLQPLA